MNGHQRGTRSRALKDLVASYFTPTRQYRQRLTSSRMRSGTYSIRSMRGQCARSRMDGDIDGGPRMPPPRSPDDHSGHSGKLLAASGAHHRAVPTNAMASGPLSAESDDTEEASPVTAGAGRSSHRGCSQPLFPVHRFWYGWKM